jgi:hypothetical protein
MENTKSFVDQNKLGKHDVFEDRTEKEPDKFEIAAKLRVMIRDGLRVDMLTEKEYKLMCEIYTEEILLQFKTGVDIPSIECSKLKFEKNN